MAQGLLGHGFCCRCLGTGKEHAQGCDRWSCPGTSAVAANEHSPTSFPLNQNYPNPFNPSTSIGYTVAGVGSRSSPVGNVRLTVYDLLGREVAVLVDEPKFPGSYEVTFEASGLATGVFRRRGIYLRPSATLSSRPSAANVQRAGKEDSLG